MKLDCVLTGINEDPLFLDFIPLFVKTWNKLYPHIDIKIILIATNIPTHLVKYQNNIILFKPIGNISTAFISQYIRLLYPAILNYKNGIMITDVDIIPMNRTYYTKNIEPFTDDKFIYFRENVCFNTNEIAMCYNVALPHIWNDIFHINSIEDIKERLIKIYKTIHYDGGRGKSGWCTDQLDLYKYVMEWNEKTNNFICLKENNTGFCRLNRNTFDINDKTIIRSIQHGKYTDYHCLRPFKQYESINNNIYKLL